MAQLQSSDRRVVRNIFRGENFRRGIWKVSETKGAFPRKRNTHVDRCPQWWGTLGLPPVTPTLARELNPRVSWWGIRRRFEKVGDKHPCVHSYTRYTARYVLDDNPYPWFISVEEKPRESILLSAATTTNFSFFFFTLNPFHDIIDRAIFFLPSSDASCSFVSRYRYLERLIAIRLWNIADFWSKLSFRSNSFRGICCLVRVIVDAWFRIFIFVYIYIYIFIRYCFRLEANLG